MSPLQPYHTGIVVDDVAAAIPVWEAATGLTWGPQVEMPLPVWLAAAGEVTTLTISMAYSSDLTVELCGHLPGTPWSLDGRTGVHHGGCWSSDLAADAARLVDQGWALLAHGVGEGGAMAMFAYFQAPGLGCFELVDAAARPGLEALVAGG